MSFPEAPASGYGRFVAEWCERAGLETSLEDASPGRPNVIAVARGTGGGGSLMLNAHTDTVGVAGMTDPFSPRVDGGRLYGRGAYDMKGSLAACMLATVEARGRALGDVVLTAVADEEFASVGAEAIAARLSADAAIVTEPTEMQVAGLPTAASSTSSIETRGRGGARAPGRELGIDAIAKMGSRRSWVSSSSTSGCARAPHTAPRLGSVHASLIEGGQEYSSYPASCVRPGRAPHDPRGDGFDRRARAARAR